MRGKRGQKNCVRKGGAVDGNIRIKEDSEAIQDGEEAETGRNQATRTAENMPKKGKKKISKDNNANISPVTTGALDSKKRSLRFGRGNSSTLQKPPKSREILNGDDKISQITPTESAGNRDNNTENSSNKENLNQGSPSHTNPISRNESQASSSSFSSPPDPSNSSRQQNNSTPFSFSVTPNNQRDLSPHNGDLSSKIFSSTIHEEKVVKHLFKIILG